MDFLLEQAKGMGSLFYLVNPYETMFKTPEEIPSPSYSFKVSSSSIFYSIQAIFIVVVVTYSLITSIRQNLFGKDGCTYEIIYHDGFLLCLLHILLIILRISKNANSFQSQKYFFSLMVLEHLILVWKGKPGIRLSDGMMSTAHGTMMALREWVVQYIFNMYHIKFVDKKWCVDFCYLLFPLIFLYF